MRFGIIANLRRTGSHDAVHALVDWADQKKQELILAEDLKPILENDFEYAPVVNLARKSDIIVSMGGDGTLLSTARAVGSVGTPILGINLGSLGFLTQLTPRQLLPALDKILEGQYGIRERMHLKVEVDDHEKIETPYALNEVALDNGPVARLLDINLKVNGEDVVTYKADGLLISTPTGSTAYNLAVGGPIVHPDLEAMIAAPISSFSLTTRPMIFPPADILEVTVTTGNRDAILTLDGQVMIPVRCDQRIRIKRAEFRSRFVTLPEISYYKLLKSKLHWGISPASPE